MLYTASYFEQKNHHGNLISISRSRPKNFAQLPTLGFLAPSQDLLKFWKDRTQTARPEDLAQYWTEYQQGFSDLLVDRMEKIDEWLASLNSGDHHTLLCWEKAGDFCHRNDVGSLIATQSSEMWGGFDVPLTQDPLKFALKEHAWNQDEFEVCGSDGTRARWRWVENKGKNTWLVKCSLGERMCQLVEIIPAKTFIDLKPSSVTEVAPEIPQDLFVNLHGHTEGSDGLMTAAEYVDQIASLGQDAAAITDHSTMAEVAKFLLACKKKGKKGIAGNELYLGVPEVTRHLKESNLQGDYKVKEKFHQLAIAINTAGYRNLCRLTTLANAVNDKRSVTFEQLESHAEGLVVTSGCVAGVIPQLILANKPLLARDWARRYQKTWGACFYVELQDHGDEMYVQLNQELVSLADELQIECVITADSHYLKKESYSAHGVFQAIKWGKTLSDKTRTPYDKDLFVCSGAELAARFDYLPSALVKRAIANTRLIANQVEEYNIWRKPTPPQYPLPAEYRDNNEYLHALATLGLQDRFPDGYREQYQERLLFELDTIKNLGLADYFLVVWDLVKFARQQGIPVGPGRGSAAGSLVTYVLRITNIDPVHHGLLFERFLNPERASMADIDLDFCPERRKEIIAYLVERYGQDRVAQISTPNTMQSKSVLQDVGRALDIPPKQRGLVTALIPNARGKGTSLKDMMEKPIEEFKGGDKAAIEQFRQMYAQDLEVKNWIDRALPLEGKRKTTGVHAAAVVVSDMPIVDFAPLRKGEDGVLATEYAMTEVEELGGLKIDVLGIANLTLLAITIQLIKQDTGDEIDPDAIPWEDKQVLSLFAKGETDGIFQFESDGMKQLLTRLKPTVFEDVVAANALFRPGPLDSGMVDRFINGKHGGRIEYPSAAVQPFLESTYGEAVYQEQLMKLAQVIAGFSLGQADLLRRACGKKKPAEMAKYKDMFVQGCLSQEHPLSLAESLWVIIDNSAEYCLDYDTKVLTVQYGYKAIGEIVEERLECDVFSVDSNGLIYTQPIAQWHNRGESDVFEYQTDSGATIRATPEHKFMTQEGKMMPIEEIFAQGLELMVVPASSRLIASSITSA